MHNKTGGLVAENENSYIPLNMLGIVKNARWTFWVSSWKTYNQRGQWLSACSKWSCSDRHRREHDRRWRTIVSSLLQNLKILEEESLTRQIFLHYQRLRDLLSSWGARCNRDSYKRCISDDHSWQRHQSLCDRSENTKYTAYKETRLNTSTDVQSHGLQQRAFYLCESKIFPFPSGHLFVLWPWAPKRRV